MALVAGVRFKPLGYCPLLGTFSTGRRNTLAEPFSRCFIIEGHC